jgi:hypothetical protein
MIRDSSDPAAIPGLNPGKTALIDFGMRSTADLGAIWGVDAGYSATSTSATSRTDEEPYRNYFRDLDAIHPQHGRPYRDIHNIWQWGITDADLTSHMNDGYTMQYYKNWGQFGHLPNVENHAFVFSR